jgi:hypothetical protein
MTLCATIVDAIRLSSRGRRSGRLRSSALASLRSDSHPSPLLTPLSRRCVCRRAVDAAGDYVRLRSLRFAPTHIHRPYLRRYRVGAIVVARSTPLSRRLRLSSRGRRSGRLRSSALASLRSDSHPSPLLTPLSRLLRLSSRGRHRYRVGCDCRRAVVVAIASVAIIVINS